jgi:ankyrin repeat protein
MGYPTDHDRGSRPHHAGSPGDTEASSTPTHHQPHPASMLENNVPRAAICVPIEDETHMAATTGLGTQAGSLASQRFKHEGEYGSNALLQGQAANEHLADRIALDSPRHPEKGIVNDGTFGTSPGSVASSNGHHRSNKPPPELSKMGPSHRRKRRNTSNTPEQELIIQNLRKAGLMSDPQHSGGRTKHRRSKEAPDPATDFHTFLKLSSQVNSQGGQPAKNTAVFPSHAHPMKKIRSLFDLKSSASKARARQSSPFADNDSGYQSGRRTPSTLQPRDSLTSHPESLTEFRGLYRVTCHTLHEPRGLYQYRETHPCLFCGFSRIHALAWSANRLKLQEFEAELKAMDLQDVQALDATGNSALHYAAISGASYAHLKALIDAGVPLYARNTTKQNFLHCLYPWDAHTESCSVDCFKLDLIKLLDLIEPKSAFGQQDNDGQTILHALASHITEPELRERTFK